MTASVVSIPFSALQDRNEDFSKELEAGFGPGGLGIVAVSNVPQYRELRQQLLHLAERLATLPENVRKSLEDPDSRYSFGWSHGKENLESGRPDLLKGSFYANPIIDVPNSDKVLMQRYPSYCRPNIWPTKDLPELEQAFKDLGRLILDVGYLLSYHCDKYVASKYPDASIDSLEESLKNSPCHKGRLLHYFPSTSLDVSLMRASCREHVSLMGASCRESSESLSSWCGWHVDHGSLTGLTCALYMKDGKEIACPDESAGLYVRTLSGEVVKVLFSENQIGYQMGEATEFLSRRLFRATPHCVRASDAVGVTRNTFALFMNPHWNHQLGIPDKGSNCKDEDGGRYMNFGDFSEKTISKYYKTDR